MKKMFLALMIAQMASACSKDDDNSGSKPAGPSLPSANLVAENGFKNTAANSKDVANHLRNSAKNLETSKFTSAGPRNTAAKIASETTPSLLESTDVQAFLGGIRMPDDDEESSPGSGWVNGGSDCTSQLDMLNQVYPSLASGLKSVSSELEKFEGTLPEGISKAPANDQFVVSYNVDLKKFAEASSKGQGSRSSEMDEVKDFSGNLIFGAGSNSDLTVLSAGANISAIDKKDQPVNVNGGVSMAAYHKEPRIKFASKSDFSGAIKLENETRPVGGSVETSLELLAGVLPEIGFNLNAKSNFSLDEKSKSVVLSDAQHSVTVGVKLKKTSNTEVTVNYDISADGKKSTGKILLAPDKFGRCTVKHST